MDQYPYNLVTLREKMRDAVEKAELWQRAWDRRRNKLREAAIRRKLDPFIEMQNVANDEELKQAAAAHAFWRDEAKMYGTAILAEKATVDAL